MELSKEEKEAIKEFRKIYENDLRKYDDFNTYMQFIIERNGIILNLISKLQKENEKQGKVINKMAEDRAKIGEPKVSAEAIKNFYFGKVEEDE